MNNRVTICHSTTHEKPQKMRYFRPNDPFVTNTPCFLGSKFEYFFTKYIVYKFSTTNFQFPPIQKTP